MILNFQSQFANINKKLSIVSDNIKKADKALSVLDTETGYSFLEDAVISTEKLFIEIREALFRLYNPKSQEISQFQKRMISGFNISVRQCTSPFHYYEITIPFLMPNQRSHAQSFKNSIGLALFSELSLFCQENDITPIKNSAVIFLTMYNEKHKRFNLDNDNKESKDVLNIISRHLITDDDGKLCDILYKTISTEHEPTTKIYISEKSNFLDLYFLLSRKNQ